MTDSDSCGTETFNFIFFSLGHIGAIFVKFVEWQYFGLESKTLTPSHKKYFILLYFIPKQVNRIFML